MVVNPTPLTADRDWKRADGRDMPVAVRAMVALRVMRRDSMATNRTRTMPYPIGSQSRPADGVEIGKGRHTRGSSPAPPPGASSPA